MAMGNTVLIDISRHLNLKFIYKQKSPTRYDDQGYNDWLVVSNSQDNIQKVASRIVPHRPPKKTHVFMSGKAMVSAIIVIVNSRWAIINHNKSIIM